ncbi:Uncharacterised protein [Yersinia frederiksenii]|nr:Uncharacterised protein [Yersinia frederiksenii]
MTYFSEIAGIYYEGAKTKKPLGFRHHNLNLISENNIYFIGFSCQSSTIRCSRMPKGLLFHCHP